MAHEFDSIFLNGTVGSGKSTVASAVSAIETTPHATARCQRDINKRRLAGGKATFCDTSWAAMAIRWG